MADSEQLDPVTWRLAAARRLAGKIQAFAGVQAIIVAGSVARGFADAYSDLELPIFWNELPTDKTRLALAAALGGEFLYNYDGPAHEDQLLIDGLQVDLWHITVAREVETFKQVLEDYSTDLGSSNFMDTVRTCIPLYGAEIIQGWKVRAWEYPDGLAVRVAAGHLNELSASELVLAAQRSNPTAFYARLSQLQAETFQVLLALNREYFPTVKWMYPILEKLPIQPTDTAGRFRQAFTLPPVEAARQMVALMKDVVTLVETHLPGVDTRRVRRRLAYTRTALP
jgi:hypothetical protein